ncbi:hypothetical protein KTN05_04060 [Paracoccus sp. Z118]|uniref:hypothetical protein n=1 Tax=Paracoccus sp. Z118 TaxID=2851017 RepID=UPI001C2C51FB|nr:hypothetical protein [Paracoccus sp. Z118]MBV0891023.1 hypothetical protein [Paracoccus sp. Z118]
MRVRLLPTHGVDGGTGKVLELAGGGGYAYPDRRREEARRLDATRGYLWEDTE